MILPADRSRATVTIDACCTACGACIATCPETALLPAPKRPLVVHHRCTGCLACVEVCPAGAVSEGWQ
jgi:flavoprotein